MTIFIERNSFLRNW